MHLARWSDVGQLEVDLNSSSLENVVNNVPWDYTGTIEGTSSLGESGSFFARDAGNVTLAPVASTDFTNYDSLTKDQVVSWVTASLGDTKITELQARISSSLAWQLNPLRVQKDTPW